MRTAAAQPDQRASIAAIYAALEVPADRSPNLDGLADVLRDLSWLADEPVTLRWQISADLDVTARRAIGRVLLAAARERVGGPRLRVLFEPLSDGSSNDDAEADQEHSD